VSGIPVAPPRGAPRFEQLAWSGLLAGGDAGAGDRAHRSAVHAVVHV